MDFNHAIIAKDNSASGAVYKGAALGQVGAATQLFVANFNSGAIEAYDSNFTRVSLPTRAFRDRSVPKGFAPFNVQNINGQLYVTYAKQNAARHDDVGGAGAGFVDVFNTSGKLLRKLQHTKALNSPWGEAVAPSSWGKLAGDILIGEFKSGEIDAFSAKNGRFVTALKDSTGTPVQIPGLWALAPGTGSATSSTQSIYFTAGVNDEQDGLLGMLNFTTSSAQNSPPPMTMPGY